MSIPAVKLVHYTAVAKTTTDYNASADTDVARGTAMLAAFADAVSGDYVLAGNRTYDWGTSYLAAADGVNFEGDGPRRTVILSQYNVVSPAIATLRPGDGSVWRGATLWANNTIKRGSPFGSQTQSGNYRNVLVEDFDLIGAIDCVHIQASGVGGGINAEVTFRRVRMYSGFDTVSVLNPNGGRIDLLFEDCYFEAVYPNPSYPYPDYSDTPTMGGLCRAIAINSGDSHAILNNCRALVGGGIQHNYGLAQLSGSGSIVSYGLDCTILDDLGGVNARTTGSGISDYTAQDVGIVREYAT